MSSLTRTIRRKLRKPEPKSRKAIEWLRARDIKEAEEWENRSKFTRFKKPRMDPNWIVK